MQPAPFHLDKPIDEMYKDFIDAWKKNRGRLPNKKDCEFWLGTPLPGDPLPENPLEFCEASGIYSKEWLDAVAPYLSSNKYEDIYFAGYILSKYSLIY